jgi:hypothetical protein
VGAVVKQLREGVKKEQKPEGGRESLARERERERDRETERERERERDSCISEQEQGMRPRLKKRTPGEQWTPLGGTLE